MVSLLFVRGVSGGVLHITSDVVRRALRLIQLSFCLHLSVASHFSDGVFDGALNLVSGALYVLLIRSSLLCFLGTETLPS